MYDSNQPNLSMKLQLQRHARLAPRHLLRTTTGALIILAAATTLVPGGPLAAQSSASAVGTLLVAHGGGPEWDVNVENLAKQVRTGGPVAVSLLMGPGASTHRFQDAVSQLVAKGAKEIVVVPVFVSSHSGHIDQVRYLAGRTDSIGTEMMHHLHMAGITRPAERVPIRVTAALDNAPELARVLADHARRLATDPSRRALFLIGHGPNSAEDNAAWMSNLRQVADSVKARTGFRDVKIGLVRDDAPDAVRAEAVKEIRETIRLQHSLTSLPVVVVPILVSAGSVSRAKIPADLHDLPVVYGATPLLPHAEMARWVEARVRESHRDASANGQPAASASQESADHGMPAHMTP
jgi:sirohydrochlorin ferrochelatase